MLVNKNKLLWEETKYMNGNISLPLVTLLVCCSWERLKELSEVLEEKEKYESDLQCYLSPSVPLLFFLVFLLSSTTFSSSIFFHLFLLLFHLLLIKHRLFLHLFSSIYLYTPSILFPLFFIFVFYFLCLPLFLYTVFYADEKKKLL